MNTTSMPWQEPREIVPMTMGDASLFSRLRLADAAWNGLMQDVRAGAARRSPVAGALHYINIQAFVTAFIDDEALAARVLEHFAQRLRAEGPTPRSLNQGSLPL